MTKDDDSPGGSEDGTFKARLSAARERQGLDPKAPPLAPKGSGSQDPSALAVGLRVGVELASALVVGVAVGYGLDWLLGTKPIFIAVFVLLGGAAGVLNVWRIYAPKRDR